MNINRTRILIYESYSPVFPGIIDSIDSRWFEIAAVVDDGSGRYSGEHRTVPFDSITDTSFWDMLIINDNVFGEHVKKILSLLNIPDERCFYLSLNVDDIGFYRTLIDPGSSWGRAIDFLHRKSGQNYVAVSAEGADYITNSKDNCISQSMFVTRENFSKEEIELFVELAERHYGTQRTVDGYFMDIGANIGTTSVYAKKNLLPNIKVIAFEPIKENYKLLSINMLLNDINDSCLINAAVADTGNSYNMKVCEVNFGSCAIVDDKEAGDGSTETVSSVMIESFLVERGISPSQVKYVWIDTEGFETEVLSAAGPLLKEQGTAFFLEYSPMYADSAKLEKLSDICSRHFKSFICIDDYKQGDVSVRPIEELYDLYKRYPKQTDIFLIK